MHHNISQPSQTKCHAVDCSLTTINCLVAFTALAGLLCTWPIHCLRTERGAVALGWVVDEARRKAKIRKTAGKDTGWQADRKRAAMEERRNANLSQLTIISKALIITSQRQSNYLKACSMVVTNIYDSTQ